jgi:hypothetical protein
MHTQGVVSRHPPAISHLASSQDHTGVNQRVTTVLRPIFSRSIL